jgi:hypothetical protein
VWLKNISLKLTALILALLLWFHVATNRVYDFDTQLAFGEAPLPAGFALTEPLPDKIRVRTSGTGKELIRLLWEEGTAQIVLEPWLDTALAVTPSRLLLAMGADIEVKQVLDPSIISVHVDTVFEAAKIVRFQGVYATAAGKSLVRAPMLVPEQVMLTGPKLLVEAILSISTEATDVQMLEGDTEREVELELGDSYNVTADPERVSIRFEVAPSVRRELPGIPIQLPPGWRSEPATVTFSVAGAEERLSSLGAEYYRAAVTVEPGSPSDTLLSVEAAVPPLVEILAVTPDRVRVFKR